MELSLSHAVLLSGLLGCALSLASYTAKTHRGLTFISTVAVLAWSAHFCLHGAWTAGVLTALTAVRVAAGAWVIHMSRAQRWQATLLAWLLAGAGAWITWNGLQSLPSTLAVMFLSWAGMHLDLRELRWALLLGEGLWLINSFVIDSTMAAVSGTLAICINSWFIWQQRRPAANLSVA